jgi:hypothetical protein
LSAIPWQSIATALSSEPLDHNGIYVHRDQIKKKLDPLCAPTILFSCFPKSGSTYITSVLKEVTGYQGAVLAYAEGGNDQQLDPIRLIQHLQTPVIAHHHMRATLANLELMHLFSIKPLIHTRNLFDSVISFKEFHEVLVDPENPMAFITDQFRVLPEQKRVDMIIDLVVPWYLHFYVSWKNFDQRFSLGIHWTCYEELLEDPQTLFDKILDSCGIQPPKHALEKALTNVGKDASTRFNKGVSGRGESLLSENQKISIRSLCSYYSDVDFSPLGISPLGI